MEDNRHDYIRLFRPAAIPVAESYYIEVDTTSQPSHDLSSILQLLPIQHLFFTLPIITLPREQSSRGSETVPELGSRIELSDAITWEWFGVFPGRALSADAIRDRQWADSLSSEYNLDHEVEDDDNEDIEDGGYDEGDYDSEEDRDSDEEDDEDAQCSNDGNGASAQDDVEEGIEDDQGIDGVRFQIYLCVGFLCSEEYDAARSDLLAGGEDMIEVNLLAQV